MSNTKVPVLRTRVKTKLSLALTETRLCERLPQGLNTAKEAQTGIYGEKQSSVLRGK